MDIKSKIKSVEMHVKMISRADDTDSAVRNAALDKVVEMIEAERAEMMARVGEKVETLG